MPPPRRTSLPLQEAVLVAETLEERFGDSLRETEGFRVEGHGLGERLFVKARLVDATKQESVEVEAQVHLPDFATPAAARMCAYDLLDSLLGTFFEAERGLFFPASWCTATFKDHSVAYRGRLRRMALERAADELLRRGG